MRDNVIKMLKDKGISENKGFDYLIEAVLLYDGQKALKDIYRYIADMYGTTRGAVEKNVALCVGSTVFDTKVTPKAFIAEVKERIMFGFDE